jgi:LysM repeat protein
MSEKAEMETKEIKETTTVTTTTTSTTKSHSSHHHHHHKEKKDNVNNVVHVCIHRPSPPFTVLPVTIGNFHILISIIIFGSQLFCYLR